MGKQVRRGPKSGDSFADKKASLAKRQATLDVQESKHNLTNILKRNPHLYSALEKHANHLGYTASDDPATGAHGLWRATFMHFCIVASLRRIVTRALPNAKLLTRTTCRAQWLVRRWIHVVRVFCRDWLFATGFLCFSCGSLLTKGVQLPEHSRLSKKRKEPLALTDDPAQGSALSNCPMHTADTDKVETIGGKPLSGSWHASRRASRSFAPQTQ